MKNKVKLFSAGLAVLAIGVGILFSNGGSFKGSLQDAAAENNASPRVQFNWIPETYTILNQGRQVRIGKFTLGATPDPEHIWTSIRVSELRFGNISTAQLSNLTLNDITNNQNVATNASSASFNSTVEGGVMPALTFQQGETRTFQILADTTVNPNQFAQLNQVSITYTPSVQRDAVTETIQSSSTRLNAGPYPTRVNFQWTPTAPSSLTTGNQAEIGRFTLGADAANDREYIGLTLSVSRISIIDRSTAHLTNLTLNDVTYNQNVATNANSTNFSSTFAGGSMPTLTFQQGEIRQFKILADVSTNVGRQTTNLTAQDIFVTIGGSGPLQIRAASQMPYTLSSASVGSDTAAPTVSVAVTRGVGAVANNGILDVNEDIVLTFNEEIDPRRINADLVYGGRVENVTAAQGGGIQIPTAARPYMNINNVLSLTGNLSTDNSVQNNWRGTISLDRAGRVLTIHTTAASPAWNSNGANGDTGVQSVNTMVGTITDTAGNRLATRGNAFVDTDF